MYIKILVSKQPSRLFKIVLEELNELQYAKGCLINVYANSEGSGEPAQMRSLTSTFAVRFDRARNLGPEIG